ncbi:MAG: SusC/RagA family TonB-linked outer membrane protein, partial [Bacteroidetes bacterium]|nr:SusC/RagA family TonB-linked outer membrane protein [Bacteroidota bacterium]
MRRTAKRRCKRPFLLGLLLFLNLSLFAQQAVTGVVKSPDGPLQGVTVKVRGTRVAGQTDKDGRFSVQAASNAVLIFSHVSYVVQEVPVSGQSELSVVLAPLSTGLGDVVVVGYGTQKKATLTGSVSVVKGEDLVKSPQPNLSNSMAGRFSGVMANNRTGEPGYDGSTFYIRGLATTGSNDVLVVVDGVPGQVGGLERLDPNDIESMTILKDASAAVYGSRAANGVILITTKRGKTGKPTINYSFNQGFASPTRLPKMADAPTYATIQNEIQYYDNPAGGLSQIYTDAQLQKLRDGSDPLNYPNTDWPKIALKKTALQNQHSLSVNGGSENVKYYVSLGLLGQDGIYKNGVTHYDQYNFRSNIDANVTDRLKVSLYLSGREEDRRYPSTSAPNLFRSIYRAYPTVSAYFPNGKPTYGIEGNNPVLQATDIGGTTDNP